MCSVILTCAFLFIPILQQVWPKATNYHGIPDLNAYSKSDKKLENKLTPLEERKFDQNKKKNSDKSNENYKTSADQNNELFSSSIQTYNMSLESNISQILDALIASHDRRIRPNYGGAPTKVNVTIHVITISAVSEVSMDYTVDLYLRQFWRDPRLTFKLPTRDQGTSLTVSIDMVKNIWVADTFFPNEKKSFFHETTTHNSFLRIDSNGNVIRSIRLTVIANCPMNLHTFPLDVQVCALEIESYGYGTNDIIYHWHHKNAVTIDENVHLAHFTIGGDYHIERTISLSTGNYSRLTAYFTFKRNIGFYLIQIYFPSSLIVVISWVSFFLNREATQARVTIGVTTVLTQTTLMTNANASLPKVSYVKSLDVFLGVCFFIVFAGLLEYAMVGYLMKRQRRFPPNRGTERFNSSENTVYCYKFDEQPSIRLSDVSQNTAEKTHLTSVKKKSPSMRQNNYPNSLKDETKPLFHFSPTHATTALTTPTFPTASNNTQNRISIFVQDTSKFDGGPITTSWCCSIRPSQVDLFSRVAFPVFFIFFHLAYWTVYLNFSL